MVVQIGQVYDDTWPYGQHGLYLILRNIRSRQWEVYDLRRGKLTWRNEAELSTMTLYSELSSTQPHSVSDSV